MKKRFLFLALSAMIGAYGVYGNDHPSGPPVKGRSYGIIVDRQASNSFDLIR